MIRHVLAAALLACGAAAATAQSLDDLNIQVHGFATQSFLYSENNSWNTTDSEHGSFAWNETVVNLSSQPQSKLRIGVQVRYFLLGDLGNNISLDWAEGDYKVNEYFGFRVGKVKTPVGLLNETQDIDPAQLWVLLPQSIYPLASRNAILAHYGGVAYGRVALGESFGKLEYRGFGGQRVVGGDDGYLQSTRDAGFTIPNGLTGRTFGGTLQWDAPIRGLIAGASENSGTSSGELDAGPYDGEVSTPRFRQTHYFSRYDRNRIMVAGEFSRLQILSLVAFPGAPPSYVPVDAYSFYGMTSYRVADKLSAGLYYSDYLNHEAAQGSSRYQKDWALTARYDFNPYLYAKLEQHFIDGTAIGYSLADNPNLKPTDRMTLLKFGVSF